jgi:hypothetical protein
MLIVDTIVPTLFLASPSLPGAHRACAVSATMQRLVSVDLMTQLLCPVALHPKTLPCMHPLDEWIKPCHVQGGQLATQVTKSQLPAATGARSTAHITGVLQQCLSAEIKP